MNKKTIIIAVVILSIILIGSYFYVKSFGSDPYTEASKSGITTKNQTTVSRSEVGDPESGATLNDSIRYFV